MSVKKIIKNVNVTIEDGVDEHEAIKLAERYIDRRFMKTVVIRPNKNGLPNIRFAKESEENVIDDIGSRPIYLDFGHCQSKLVAIDGFDITEVEQWQLVAAKRLYLSDIAIGYNPAGTLSVDD